MPSPDHEPIVPGPEQAAAQMREATERLREQGWMVAPLTSPPPTTLPQQADRLDADRW